jgi:cytochrome c oxidase subunit 3
MAQQVSEAALTREELMALRNKRTGMNIFQLSWIMVFVCLVVINYFIRTNFASWPPEGVERMSAVLPTLVTALLLVSVFTVRRAQQAMDADAVAQFLTQWRATLVLGVLFIIGMAVSWVSINDAGQYGALARVMVAYHAIHALAIGAYMWVVDGRVRAGKISSRDTWDVEAGVKLWYFVVIAWVLFYIPLYVL